MREALYEHFADVFGMGGSLDFGQALWDFLADDPRLSMRDTNDVKGTITALRGVILVLRDRPKKKSQSNGGLPYEFSSS